LLKVILKYVSILHANGCEISKKLEFTPKKSSNELFVSSADMVWWLSRFRRMQVASAHSNMKSRSSELPMNGDSSRTARAEDLPPAQVT